MVSELVLNAREGRENERLAALARTGLLDSERDETFDRYVRMAQSMVDVPIALVSLIDERRQWFKSRVGLAPQETPRELAFCAHAIRHDAIFEVPDARSDARFRDNALVTGSPHIRFYAGAPIKVEARHRLGTICVIDTEPRELTPLQRRGLGDLAATVAREIETNHLFDQRMNREAATLTVAREMAHQSRNLFAKIGAIIALSGREAHSTDELAEMSRRRVAAFGWTTEALLARGWRGIPLRQLAEEAVRPAAEDALPVIEMNGPDLLISSAAAGVLGPLLNELACDANLRGVFGQDGSEGAVSLEWAVDADSLALAWTEKGPQAGGPAFRGDYLNEIAPSALHGAARIEGAGTRYVLLAATETVLARDP